MEEVRSGGWDDIMGLLGCTGDTATEREVREVGDEVAGVGVDGALFIFFYSRRT